MATIHVKVSGDDGSGDGSDGNPYRTIDFALGVASIGGTSFESSADEILVHYDGASTYPGNWAAVARAGIPVIGVDSQGIRWDNRQHYITTSDDTAGLFSRQERPKVISGTGSVINAYEWQSWYGLDIDGNSGSGNGVSGTGDQEMKFVDCMIHDCGGSGVLSIETGSLFIRTDIWNTASGSIMSSTRPTITVAGCRFYDNFGVLNLTGSLVLVENCVLFGNGNGSGTAANITTGTCRNVICQDNNTAYGFPTTGTLETCNSYTSNSGSFHTSGNYNGTPAVGNREIDALFVDSASDDYRLENYSRLTYDGTTIATALLDVDLDGVDWTSDPSIGSYQFPLSPFLLMTPDDGMGVLYQRPYFVIVNDAPS